MKTAKKKIKKKWICFYCHRINEAGKMKCIYCGERKVGDLKKLEGDLDRIFSKFIRLRDNYICVTCAKAGNDAGHFKKRSHRSTRWDEKNVNCQCTSCNTYRGGNLIEYTIYLQNKFGYEIIVELNEKAKDVFKPTRVWLLEQIEIYKKKLKEMPDDFKMAQKAL